jgi:hypothetical protein
MPSRGGCKIQERLTQQVAQTTEQIIDPVGVGAICEARHFCMMFRGVEKHHSGAMTIAWAQAEGRPIGPAATTALSRKSRHAAYRAGFANRLKKLSLYHSGRAVSLATRCNRFAIT